MTISTSISVSTSKETRSTRNSTSFGAMTNGTSPTSQTISPVRRQSPDSATTRRVERSTSIRWKGERPSPLIIGIKRVGNRHGFEGGWKRMLRGTTSSLTPKRCGTGTSTSELRHGENHDEPQLDEQCDRGGVDDGGRRRGGGACLPQRKGSGGCEELSRGSQGERRGGVCPLGRASIRTGRRFDWGGGSRGRLRQGGKGDHAGGTIGHGALPVRKDTVHRCLPARPVDPSRDLQDFGRQCGEVARGTEGVSEACAGTAAGLRARRRLDGERRIDRRAARVARSGRKAGRRVRLVREATGRR